MYIVARTCHQTHNTFILYGELKLFWNFYFCDCTDYMYRQMWAVSGERWATLSMLLFPLNATKLYQEQQQEPKSNACNYSISLFTIYYLRVGLTGTKYKQHFFQFPFFALEMGVDVLCIMPSSFVLKHVFIESFFFVEEDVGTFGPVVFCLRCHYQPG